MCGIAGFIGNRSNQELFLKNAVQHLQSRGPDGQGILNLGWAGLAHTRLALIDLGEGGRQPRTSEYVSIAFNGEIYNWKVLRKDLETRGAKFDSDSDTEVLLKYIIQFGLPETLSKVRGIFAFALLEEKTKKITLVRDRFGTKPLYYSISNGSLTFGSEISVLEAALSVSKESLEEYLTFQNFTGSKTLFRNIHLLEPGVTLEFNLSSPNPVFTKWTDVTQLQENTNDYQENLETTESLFVTSITRNLSADVPIGTFLSGGIDSGLIAIFASKQEKSINSFSIGFEVSQLAPEFNSLDELPAAQALAKQLGINSFDMILGESDMWNSLSTVASALEEPRVGQSYPNYYASGIAAKRNKAVMAGTGGDEFFGGYPWRYGAALNGLTSKKEQISSLYELWHRLLPPTDLSSILGVNEIDHEFEICKIIESILEKNSVNEQSYTVRDLMYFDMKVFLHGLLVVEDKLSMHHGLEVRVPFLDEDLVNFALTLPESHLLRRKINSDSQLEGKILLRDIMKKMDVGFHHGVKKGFTGPDEIWFRDRAKVAKIIGREALIWDFLHREKTQNLIELHFQGKKNLRLLLWSLVQLELTLRKLTV